MSCPQARPESSSKWSSFRSTVITAGFIYNYRQAQSACKGLDCYLLYYMWTIRLHNYFSTIEQCFFCRWCCCMKCYYYSYLPVLTIHQIDRGMGWVIRSYFSCLVRALMTSLLQTNVCYAIILSGTTLHKKCINPDVNQAFTEKLVRQWLNT